MKRVLIITYYWPPSGGGGVQRWLKFAKYLPEFGWEPVIYTPENPDFEIVDNSLLDEISSRTEVIKRPIWEPFGLYRFLLGKKGAKAQGVVQNSNQSILQKLSLWVRGNLFVPDPRVFWVKPSIRFLKKYINENKIDLIVTTGPPHSMHLIGLGLKKKVDIKWVADFRDPWSDWDVQDLLKVSNRTKNKIKNLEAEVIKQCDARITVGSRLAKKMETLVPNKNFSVVMNGFDESDYTGSYTSTFDKFRISHLGLLNEGRNPTYLWEVLSELCNEDEQFANSLEIELAGVVEESVLESLMSYENLISCVKSIGYLTHNEVLEAYGRASVLLLMINKTDNAPWIITGKIFECIRSLKPILALGPKPSDANDILVDVGQNEFVSYDDKEVIKNRILSAYRSFGKGQNNIVSNKVDKYSRVKLSEQLAMLFDSLKEP